MGEANLAYEGGHVATKTVNLAECAGQVSIDRYVHPDTEPEGPAPGQPEAALRLQQEICSDGREPALRRLAAYLSLLGHL